MADETTEPAPTLTEGANPAPTPQDLAHEAKGLLHSVKLRLIELIKSDETFVGDHIHIAVAHVTDTISRIESWLEEKNKELATKAEAALADETPQA